MTLRLEKQGKIAHLLIDRPDKRNAFNQKMWELFPELLGEGDGGCSGPGADRARKPERQRLLRRC